MTVPGRSARPESPYPDRPALSVVRDCVGCGDRLVEVRDRDGRPVPFDADAAGRAVRSPDGEWWAVRFNGRWRVVRPEPGEDPPVGGHRFRAHRCAPASMPEVDSGPELVWPEVPAFEAGVARRPPRRTSGLRDAPCRQWRREPAPPGGPYHRMCVVCGRVTVRVDGDGLPWCGGGKP